MLTTLKIRRVLIPILVLLLLVVVKPAEPQNIKDILNDATDKIPSLDSFTKEKPAISTGLKDAVTEVPFLDDFNPTSMGQMTWLPRKSGGQFRLTHSGVFRFMSQSYCLHAGTYAPTEGDGYLYAPMAGPRAMIIKAILERTWNRPEIEQNNIQTLIWAILSHTKINDMSGENLTLAMSILTKGEIADLNGGALGMVPDKLMGKAMDKITPALRPIFEAESKLRGLMTVPGTSYGELERVAVLTGAHTPGKDSREIPRGRWSYHYDGYFLRYFPSGYPTTEIQISVPGHFTITRDSKGRVISVADDFNSKIEAVYDDSANPMQVPNDSGISGYKLKAVKYTHRLSSSHPESTMMQTVEWNNTGWTFTGNPNGKGQIGNTSGTYSNAKNRYENANNLKKELDTIVTNATKARGKNAGRGAESDFADAIDLASLTFAIGESIGDVKDDDKFSIGPVEFLQKAWQYSVCIASGASPVKGAVARSGEPGIYREKPTLIAALFGEDKYVSDIPNPVFYLAGLSNGQMLAMNPDEGGDGGGGDGGDGASFDSCQGVACPGDTGSQRLKPSPREDDDPEKDDDPCKASLEALKNALRWAEAYSDQDVLDKSTDARDYINNVENKAQENYKAETGKDGQVTSDVGVGTDCQLYIDGNVSTFDDFRKWLESAEDGLPPEVIDALVEHERTHMAQCYKDDDFGTDTDTKEDLSKAEIEAYCMEAQMIMDYLNGECDSVPSDLQDKFNALCGG